MYASSRVHSIFEFKLGHLKPNYFEQQQFQVTVVISSFMAMNKQAALATEDQQQASLISSFFLTGHLALISHHQSKCLYILLLDRYMYEPNTQNTIIFTSNQYQTKLLETCQKLAAAVFNRIDQINGIFSPSKSNKALGIPIIWS